MSALVLLLLRGQQPVRTIGVAASAGAVAALLLLAVAVLRLPSQVEEHLFPLLSEPGLRPGYVLSLVLLTAPVLLLLYQLLRLGTTARMRRLAVLRVAGATPVQVRLLSALELVVPALLGAAVLGPAAYAVLRALFGGTPAGSGVEGEAFPSGAGDGFVPVTVTPGAVDVLAVVAVTTLACGLIGWLVSRDVVVSAHPVSRRASPRRPRPWPMLLIVAAFALTVPLLANTLAVVVGIGVAALGLLLSGPWIALRAGRRAAERADGAEELLAGSRAVADPWAAGRAVAPIAVVGLVGAGSGALLLDLIAYGNFYGFYIISLGLVAIALLVVLTFVVFALATHGVETLSEHRRSTASLVADGASLEVLHRSLVAEARLLARPAATLGLLVGTAAMVVVTAPSGDGDLSLLALLGTGVLVLVVLLLLIEVAARTASRLVRPWLVAAASPDGLRTE
ncbi:FtsX-like permease family protein [Microlunatus flavus]|uniref:FtsX-like permease family protein n=1 Tax=Microlunatus flavus TaxID=1036181 RepID=A0A1H9FPV0_9ACTN|nr:FtsX-like permease family protein [Microlunatus flavus]SEQ39927.1 FtsX-like permease family protein [Microlunatus flavus]